MLCGAVGAGDSLLLLLGDSVESKGRISVPRLLFLGCFFLSHPGDALRVGARGERFSPDKSEDGAGCFSAAVVSLFFGSGGGGSSFLQPQTDAVRKVIKGLLVSAG